MSRRLRGLGEAKFRLCGLRGNGHAPGLTSLPAASGALLQATDFPPRLVGTNMKTEDEKKTQQGEDATQTALNEEAEDQEQEMGLETDQLIIQDEVGESNTNEEQDEEGGESNANENEQDGEGNKDDNGTEEAKDSDKTGKANNDANDDKKHRLSGAARKRLRYLISQGYSKEEARERSLRPVTGKRDGSPDSRSSKKGRKEEGIKICVVLEHYPDEVLSTEQLKCIQEAITDKILEMGQDATVKPKFHSSTHQQGWLAIICADKPTMEWLKEIVPTISPVEESSLKALEDDEMPYLETYVAFLPDSQDYSDEKILKLLEHQNDSFSVANWKVIKKETIEDELEVTFSIDRKHSVELKKSGYKACYKFGHVQLYPKEKDKKRSASTERKESSKSEGSDSKRSKLSPRRRSPDRSEWRGEGGKKYNRKPEWKKPKRGGSGGRGFRGGSRANEFRAGGSSWSNNSSTRNNQSWFADPWKPWKNN